VTAVSGSGPAYFFHLMELMIDFAVGNGIPRKVAETLAIQTAVGGGLLAESASVSPSRLREMVTSKKGTTDAALRILKSKKFGQIFKQGLLAATKRSKQLSK